MIEADWLSCTNPSLLLDYIASRASARKLRLFACGCCRHVSHLLTDERSRRAVEVTERYADGVATAREVAQARMEALQPAHRTEGQAAWAVFWATKERLAECVENTSSAAAEAAARAAARGAPGDKAGVWNAVLTATQQGQVRLLRDLFGNPFRPVPWEPRWRTQTVTQLAEAIYADRAFDQLPILADALEEAGCTSAEVLNHCRQPGEHARGCWAVDLVLAKE